MDNATPSPPIAPCGAAKPLPRLLKRVGWVLVWIVVLGCVAWSFGALHYDFPVLKSVVAWVFLLGVLAALVFLRGPGRILGTMFAAFILVLAWWLTLKPINVGDWQPDVAQLARVEIDGDTVTLHNVRNCDYRTVSDLTPRRESRFVRISQITGIDIAITTNCTTSIRTQHSSGERPRWDWRMLLNGKGDELMYERDIIAKSGLPFANLRMRSLINKVAKEANDSPEFSRLIREGHPGMKELTHSTRSNLEEP